MILEDTANTLKGLVDQWKAEYAANQAKDPENWPDHEHFSNWYEDFSVWLELRELHL